MTSERLASAISLVFNPAIIAAITFLILLYSEAEVQIALSLLCACFVFGTLIPLAMIYQLSKRGLISDVFVPVKEERVTPFVGAIVSYVVGSAVLFLMRAPTIVTALMLSYAGNTTIMMLITLRWKISVHASGIAGPATALIYALGVEATVFFGLLIPIAWARIRLRAHSPLQMLAGAIITIVATWAQLRFYLSIL